MKPAVGHNTKSLAAGRLGRKIRLRLKVEIKGVRHTAQGVR